MDNDNIIGFEKYLPMDEFDSKWYFYDEEIRIPDADIANIRPLSKKYGGMLWEKYISKKSRHLMLMGKDEKPFTLTLLDYNWQYDWNKNDYESLRSYLSDKVSFQPDELIIFFWMKGSAVETNWGSFIKYWINFLFEDEAPILISPKRKDVISFGPTGALLIGTRVDI